MLLLYVAVKYPQMCVWPPSAAWRDLHLHPPTPSRMPARAALSQSIATRGKGVKRRGVGREGLSLEGLVAHDCGYPLSRYTCRTTRVAADFLDFIAFCRCSTGVALHPLNILVSHPPPPRNLGLKRCRATRGCRSYSCGCRATLCN